MKLKNILTGSLAGVLLSRLPQRMHRPYGNGIRSNHVYQLLQYKG